MKRVFYGETHGGMEFLYPKMRKRHPDADEIIICGEEGFGFNRDDAVRGYANLIQKKPYISFIRGNHSNPEVCKTFKGPEIRFIEDGSIENGVLFIGGAASIDRDYRTPGLDWWPDEELSEQRFEEIIKEVNERKYEIHTVVTHDAPRAVQSFILPEHKPIIQTRTDFYLEEIRKILNPFISRWIFAHYHIGRQFSYEGVLYTCLSDSNIVDYVVLED